MDSALPASLLPFAIFPLAQPAGRASLLAQQLPCLLPATGAAGEYRRCEPAVPRWASAASSLRAACPREANEHEPWPLASAASAWEEPNHPFGSEALASAQAVPQHFSLAQTAQHGGGHRPHLHPHRHQDQQRRVAASTPASRGEDGEGEDDRAPRLGEVVGPRCRPFACAVGGCRKSFNTEGQLRNHAKTHSGSRPFGCPWADCERAFPSDSSLRIHIRTHTGERPFPCSVQGCGKAFTTSGNLRAHQRVHTGEKPFVCPFTNCLKAFGDAGSLTKHKRVHTGERPFLCGQCGRCFSQAGHLSRHKQMHGQ